MPTIEELRQVWPATRDVPDDLLQSPWFHVGVLRSGLAEGERLKLSIDVISEALAAAETAARS